MNVSWKLSARPSLKPKSELWYQSSDWNSILKSPFTRLQQRNNKHDYIIKSYCKHLDIVLRIQWPTRLSSCIANTHKIEMLELLCLMWFCLSGHSIHATNILEAMLVNHKIAWQTHKSLPRVRPELSFLMDSHKIKCLIKLNPNITSFVYIVKEAEYCRMLLHLGVSTRSK
jgi:hypothetical protein